MNEKKAWQRVANMERRTKNYRRNVKQKCIRHIAKGILKKYKVPIYETDQNGQVIKDQNGNKIAKKRSYKNKNGKRITYIKTRKLLGYEDFKKHFVVISKHNDKKLNLVVKIVSLITKINELKSKTTNLNEIANKYYEKLQSLEGSKSDSDQSNQQQSDTDTDQDINNDQGSQSNQIDTNNSDSDNSDEKKNQNSGHFYFSDPNSNSDDS